MERLILRFAPGSAETFEGYWRNVEQLRRADRRELECIKSHPPEHKKALQPIPEGEPVGEFLTDHVLVLKRGPEWAAGKSRRADELIAVWDERRTARDRAIEPVRRNEEVYDEAADAFCDSLSDLSAVPAVTFAGVIAKAHAARLETDETEARDTPTASIVDDVIALGARSGAAPAPLKELAL